MGRNRPIIPQAGPCVPPAPVTGVQRGDPDTGMSGPASR